MARIRRCFKKGRATSQSLCSLSKIGDLSVQALDHHTAAPWSSPPANRIAPPHNARAHLLSLSLFQMLRLLPLTLWVAGTLASDQVVLAPASGVSRFSTCPTDPPVSCPPSKTEVDRCCTNSPGGQLLL